jgi:microcystin-dependent protein
MNVNSPINTDATPTNVKNVPSSNAILCSGKAGAMTATIYTTNPPTANANLKSFQAQTNITVPSPAVTVTSNCGANVAPVPAAPFSTISPYLCVNYIIAIQGIYPVRD